MSRARREGETYEVYRINIKLEQLAEKAKLRGVYMTKHEGCNRKDARKIIARQGPEFRAKAEALVNGAKSQTTTHRKMGG